MPITIPMAQEHVDFRTPTVPAPVLAKPIPEAFGAAPAAAGEEIGAKLTDLGGVLARHAVAQQQQDDEQKVISADTQFRQQMQDVLNNPEADENGAPKGILNRSLGQARGATLDLQDQYAKMRKDYLDQMSDTPTKAALAARMDGNYVQVRDMVVRHEAQQRDEAYKTDLDANLKQRVSDAAALQDPAALSSAIDQARVVQTQGMSKLGRGEAEIGLSSQLLASDMTRSSVGAVLEKDPARAQQLLDAAKPKMEAQAAAAVQQTIDGKMFADKAANLWGSLSGGNAFRLSDGNWDMAGLQSAVMDLQDQPQDKKEKLWDYVKSRADEDRVNTTRSDQANDRSFYDAALQAKSQGQPLSEALKLSTGFNARDAYDVQQRAEVLKRLYAPVTETDPQTYIGLWERIQNGGGSKQEIDGAFNKQALNPGDWRSLREDFYKSQLEGIAPAQKQTYDRIKLLAEQTFGSNEKQKDAFLYEMKTEGRGLPPEEFLKLATDKLKVDDSTRAHFPVLGMAVPFTGQKGYQADLARQDAANLAWGTVYSDLGRDTTLSIGRGILAAGKPSFGISDVAGFASQLGGYENIRPGTPAGNAIKSLSGHGQLVTPANVRAVLARYKDGNY